jgi:hypothetical protein
MTKTCQTYIEAIKLKLATSIIVQDIDIVQERVLDDTGYFRARLRLTNGDFLEVSEFFKVSSDRIQTIEYRYQWMDSSKKELRKRWDNARHHPTKQNFPHHVHVGDDKFVEPGELLSIVEALDVIEQQMQG